MPTRRRAFLRTRSVPTKSCRWLRRRAISNPRTGQFPHSGRSKRSPVQTRRGRDGTSKKLKKEPAAAKSKKKAPEPKADEVPAEPPKTSKPPRAADKASSPTPSKVPKPALIAGGVAALLVAAVGGWAMFGRGGESTQKAPTNAASTGAYVPQQVTNLEVAELASATGTLANDARTAGAPATAVSDLVAAGDKLNAQSAQFQGSRPIRPGRGGEEPGRRNEANRDRGQRRVRKRLAARRRGARQPGVGGRSLVDGFRRAHGRTAQRRLAPQRLARRFAVGGRDRRPGYDPVQSLNAARNALASSQTFVSVIPSAYRVEAALRRTPEAQLPKPPKEIATTTRTTTVKTATATPKIPEKEVVSTGGGLSPAKLSQFNAIVADGRGWPEVMRNPSAGANAKLAKNYDSYLATLQGSMRGVKTDREADGLIASAKRTRAYLSFLVKQSGG